VLRAPTACTFSTSETQNIVRACGAFAILTSKCASRHNGVIFSTSQLPKVLRTCQFLTLLTSKCASCHNCVRFFNISTSKSAPTLVSFVRFDLEMCFAPQRHALFPHHNFQKCSKPVVFCSVSVSAWKCASRHNCVQFFISSGQMAPHP